MNLCFDLHVHTYHSPCGQDEMTPSDIVRTASERGITHLGITDHFYPFTDPRIFEVIRRDVERTTARMSNPPRVFYGCEAEVMAPGKTAGSAELADRLDYVLAGATHFQNLGITELPEGMDEVETARYFLQMFEYAASLPWVDVVAHPFFAVPSVCSSKILRYLDESDLLPALEIARENDVAMEISRRALHTPGQAEFSMRFYPLCKRMGLRFSLGSDAHSIADIGNIRVVEPILIEAGIGEKDFWLPQSKTRAEHTADSAAGD